MSGILYSTWTPEQIREAIRDSEENLASLAASVASADGTSTSFRSTEKIEKIIADLNKALVAAENGGPRRRFRRLNFMHYGRFRRFMR